MPPAGFDDLVPRLAARWPEVRVDAATLARELEARRIPPDSPRAEDVALVVALAARDPAALVVFDRELVPEIRGALVRHLRDDDLIEEALQRVRVKLLVEDDPPRIGQYLGRGALGAWIRIVAIREALLVQRANQRERPTDDRLLELAVTDPLLAQTRAVHRDALNEAFRRAFAMLDDRERTLLRLCFVEGLATEELARLFHVHRVTAFRWLRDARAALLERTREPFAAATGVRDSEVDSLMRSLAESLSVPW